MMNKRNFTKCIFMLVILMGINIAPAKAQLDRIAIGLEAGLSFNRLSGDLRDKLDSDIQELENSRESFDKFKARMPDVKALNLGIVIEFSISEYLAIRSGIRLNKRGYNLKVKGETDESNSQITYSGEADPSVPVC